MAPDGWVVDVAAEKAGDGRGGVEAHLQTAVVAACEAGFAGVAGERRFNGHSVAGFQVGDGGMDGEDFAGGFMAQDVVVCDDHGANAAGMPEVDVGAADTGCADGDGHLAFLELFAILDTFEGGFCFGYPKLVVGICEDANVWLGEGGGARHGESRLSVSAESQYSGDSSRAK